MLELSISIIYTYFFDVGFIQTSTRSGTNENPDMKVLSGDSKHWVVVSKTVNNER